MKADLILKSSAVFTGTEEVPFEGAVAIAGNRIMKVIRGKETGDLTGKETKVIDLGDRLVLPGLIDSHVHFFMGAFSTSKYMLDLTDAKSEKECAERVKKRNEEHPEYKTIFGLGWFPSAWTVHDFPDKKSLDAVVPDKPVYLQSADAHTFWLNSRALEECGITKEMAEQDAHILLGQDGELSGLLVDIGLNYHVCENAMHLEKNEFRKLLEGFLGEIARNGITSVADLSISAEGNDDTAQYEFLKILEQEEKLTARVHLYPGLGMKPDYTHIRELKEKYHSEKLQIAGLKQFADGVTSSRTAYLLQPYTDAPETRGSLILDAETYETCILQANKEGFGVRLHAIGDAAVHLGLDIFEKSVKQNTEASFRNSLEHCENIHPRDIQRFAETGTIASVQPEHLVQDHFEKIERIGAERSKLEWPFRDLLDAGAVLAFGTDFPVVGLNPYENMAAAVTRCFSDGTSLSQNPEQKITLAEAIRAYTWGGAYSHHREEELGTLEKGKLADITVVNENLFCIAPDRVRNCRTALTIMDGKIVYQEKQDK